MSLRARILAGSAAIAVVLVAAAFVIARMTEAHLVERVDTQLESRGPSFQAGGVGRRILIDRGAAADGGCVARTTEPDTSADGAGGDGSTDEGARVTCPEEPPSTADDADAAEVRCDSETDCPPPDTGQAIGTVETFQLSEELSPFFISLVTADGVEPQLEPEGDQPIPEIDREQAIAAATAGEPYTTGSENSDTRFRVIAVSDQLSGNVWVVSQSLADVDAIVGRLVAVESVAILTILAALGLVAWWVNRHGIRPVERMTATASAIAAGDLSLRVPKVDYGTEAGRLGSALNQMLARIEKAFEERTRSEGRLRQFVADASHELRTPVTTIRGYSELYESGGLATDDELSEAMRRTRQEALRMGNLVDDMLLLARLDEGRDLDRSRVDLAALVSDAGRDARAVDPDRVVVTTTDGPLEVVGDSDRLRQVIANLVGNALVHTPSSAAIHIRAHRDDASGSRADHAVVEVADRGPGMTPEVLDQAFDRFFRADPSRSRHRGGSGLGLAIVQAAVAAHGGEVTLASVPDEGTTARVVLPLAPDTDTDAS